MSATRKSSVSVSPAPVVSQADLMAQAVSNAVNSPAYMDGLARMIAGFLAPAPVPAPVPAPITRAPAPVPAPAPVSVSHALSLSIAGETIDTSGVKLTVQDGTTVMRKNDKTGKLEPHVKLFASGKTGYTLTGKVWIDGKRHQFSLNIIELAEK